MTRKLPDKLHAIALDNELSGEVAQENREDVTVVVRIGGQDNEGAPFNTHRPPLRFDAENDGHSRRVQDRVTADATTIEQAQDLSATATLLDRYEFRESSCRLTSTGNGPLTGSAASTVD